MTSVTMESTLSVIPKIKTSVFRQGAAGGFWRDRSLSKEQVACAREGVIHGSVYQG